MVYDLFDALLYAVCHYFVEDFSISVHQGYWSIVFFVMSFVWFWT